MCGIAGFIHRDGARPAGAELLATMRDLLYMRGPDDKGARAADGAGLAHRRLSVIDISGGHQPMSNDAGTLWITYNGEIYNFRELRQRLEGLGHRFHTRCDTEVVLRAYEAFGPDCVDQFNGMFAFLIWDEKERTAFAARDRLGKKPFYYAQWDDTFIFASEIKAILAYDGFPARLNEEVLEEYLTFGYVTDPNTMFQGVVTLPPGCCLFLKGGEVTVRDYWDVRRGEGRPPTSPAAAADELDALLNDAVSMRLVSDVPVGTFNSGGVDSSLVTAMVAGIKKEPLHTFSVGFEEPDYDESPYARMLAEQYGTTHHEIVVSGKEFADQLPGMVYYHDEPLNHPNSVLIYKVSELAKRYVTVVLTGEGADELFAGYPRYFISRMARALRAVPLAARAAAAASSLTGDHRLVKLAAASRMGDTDSLLFNSSLTRPELARTLLGRPRSPRHLESRLSRLEAACGDTLDRLLFLDLRTYLVSILMRQDKMSMATAIESRIPFLDYRVVEFGFGLHSSLKQSGTRTKKIVKDVARRYLPKAIVDRRKSGFGVPLDRWFADEEALGRFAGEIQAASDAYLDGDAVRDFLRAGGRRVDYHEVLWSLANLGIWHRVFIEGRGLEWARGQAGDAG